MLTSTSWLDNSGQIHILVYQGSDGTLVERCWDSDSWYTGAFSSDEGTAVGATSWVADGQVFIRVYVVGESGAVTERCWDGSSWYTGAFTSDTALRAWSRPAPTTSVRCGEPWGGSLVRAGAGRCTMRATHGCIRIPSIVVSVRIGVVPTS